ncbi:MAG: metallophosphoesterase, partial [bacterium]
SSWGSDTNYPLFSIAMSSIKNNSSDATMFIFTGDMLVHSFSSKFYALYGSTDEAAMKAFADKTVAFLTLYIRSYCENVPILFALGNNDSYADYQPEPNGSFLVNSAEHFYTNFLNSIPDHQTFVNTYDAGGYYVIDPVGSKLEVVVLNTVLFSVDAVGDVDAAAQAELDWFSATMASAKASGKKVWILIHVPPGANIHKTATYVDQNGHITEAKMMWQTTYQERFLQILSSYSDIVTMMLAGHTHMDEYKLPDGFLEITPAISPIDGNNPAFKIFTVSSDDFQPSNYVAWNYDLASKPAQFTNYYTFSAAYPGIGTLDTFLAQLYSLFSSNADDKSHYENYYFSGHSTPITDANWPVFWCGIKMMTEQDMINCVNTY